MHFVERRGFRLAGAFVLLHVHLECKYLNHEELQLDVTGYSSW